MLSSCNYNVLFCKCTETNSVFMTHALPHKTKQFFVVLIKLSIVFGAFYFIYHKIVNNEQIRFMAFVGFVSKKGLFYPKTILFILFLTLINWFFEILKWQNLAASVKKISFKEALAQSLSALTASLFTPNRIGEYGAKPAYFEAPLRKQILLLTLLGNLSQMLATVLFGGIGLVFFVAQFDLGIAYQNLSGLLLVIGWFAFFIRYVVKQHKLKYKGMSLQRLILHIKTIPFKIHYTNIAFAMLRYAVFSFQFYFLLKVFGASVTYAEAIMTITSMYLLVSAIPSIFIFDVVVKGSVAVFLFSFLNVNELIVLSTIMSMWLLNFVLPSVLGSYYVLNFNWQTATE